MSALPQELYPPAEAGKSLRDYGAIARRRRGLMLLVLSLLLAVTLAVALLLPPVYRSTATILIKEQEIPQEFVRSTVTSFADERIQVISQQVMTRATLLDLVDRYSLYGAARQKLTSEDILDLMRRDIKLTPISAEVTDRRTGSPVKSTIAFSLSYDSESAANAQKIANELVTLYLNENVKSRQQKAAETTSFLDEELTRVSEHISELEQQITDFKRKNQGRTPDLGAANQIGAERTSIDLQRLERDITFIEERKLSLQTQLAETKPSTPVIGNGGVILEPEDRLKSLQLQLTTMTGTLSNDHPDVKRLRREIATLQTETGLQDDASERETKLAELQGQLSLLRQKYAEDHPDVVALKRAYTALDKAVRTGADGPADRAGTLRRARKADNPVYLNLKSQIDTVNAQLQSMRTERGELRAKQAQFDVRLSQTPEVEREYLELARDLGGSRDRFRELRDKQSKAQVAEQLERGRKAERFTLIEPPIFPEKPYRPNRALILAIGALLAMAASVAAAAMRESLDQTVHSPRDVARVLQVPMLAVLPSLPSPERLRRRSMQRWALAAASSGALLIALLVFHLAVMPLDIAWFGLLRRLGG